LPPDANRSKWPLTAQKQNFVAFDPGPKRPVESFGTLDGKGGSSGSGAAPRAVSSPIDGDSQCFSVSWSERHQSDSAEGNIGVGPQNLSEPTAQSAPRDRESQSRAAAIGAPRIAVFDLDGTLLAGDSTAAWLRTLLFSTWLRRIAAAIALPVCLFLVWIPSSRKVGASILLWIATAGRDPEAITDSIQAFAKRVEQGAGAVRWRGDGLATLQGHLAAGDRVIVVTAAPAWLAAPLLASWPQVRVIGSTLARRWRGWVIEDHCFGKQKCRALQQKGYGSEWDFVYTDSYDDAPLLAAATEGAFIVNPRRGLVAKLRTRVQSRISPLRWT
jgi:phosphatidylglycerophosphatase C